VPAGQSALVVQLANDGTYNPRPPISFTYQPRLLLVLLVLYY